MFSFKKSLTAWSFLRSVQWMAKGRKYMYIVETVTLLDYKDNVEDDDGIVDVPPVSSYSEAYSLINKLTMAEGTR